MRTAFAVLALGGFALAQESIPTDISTWFASTASLAAVVASLVALLRKHVLKGLDGAYVVLLSLVLGVGLAYLGKSLGYLGSDWVVFGLAAGLVASGGVDLARSVAGKSGAQGGSASTDADASRVRLR